MWARVVEVMLGCWLALSPFIFRPPISDWRIWVNDFVCAALVITLGLVSYWRPLKHAHLVTGLVALWLMAFGYFAAPHPLPPALQNDLMVGLLLVMFAIVPNEATLPPQAWREFYAKQEQYREQ